MHNSKAFVISLKQSFLYRAQAVFYSRLCLNSFYLFFWLISGVLDNQTFPHTLGDIFLIITAFSYSILVFQYKTYPFARWLHFITLIGDLIILAILSRNDMILSPLITIAPLITAAFLLLFHNPILMAFPLSLLPILTLLYLRTSDTPDFYALCFSLILYCAQNAMIIFFIHLSHSKEHKLLRSMVTLQKKLKELALLKERTRIAQDFHDGVGANLASISLQCDVLLRSIKAEDIRHDLRLIKECATESIEDMRRSLSFLQGSFDVNEQIELLLEKPRAQGFTTKNSGTEVLKELSEAQQIACCRVLNEAVINALKHARAKQISLTAIKQEGLVRVEVKDDGIGFEGGLEKPHHYGLKNMADRMAQMGGSFSLNSQKHGGTSISLEIPIR